MKHTIPVGTSEPQDFELRARGAPMNGSGLDLTIEIAGLVALGTPLAVETPPTVAWLDRTAGTVRVSDVDALPVGSYKVRFKLTDAAGKIGYAPNGSKPDVWCVVPAL